jgi:hypothetical protein
MKTVDFRVSYMGDAVLISLRSWKRVEKFLKQHGFKMYTMRKEAPHGK